MQRPQKGHQVGGEALTFSMYCFLMFSAGCHLANNSKNSLIKRFPLIRIWNLFFSSFRAKSLWEQKGARGGCVGVTPICGASSHPPTWPGKGAQET